MKIRQTSLMAYFDKDSGRIFGEQTKKIFFFLQDQYPRAYTRNQLSVILGIRINAICGRVNELLKANWVEEADKVRDEHSNKLNYLVRFKKRVYT